MAVSIEREKLVPRGVEKRAEEFTAQVEKAGVTASANDFKAQVSDDSGKPIIQTPQNEEIAIEIPAQGATLKTWAKGPITSALTWLGRFWLRIIKKALHFGWKIVVGGKNVG